MICAFAAVACKQHHHGSAAHRQNSYTASGLFSEYVSIHKCCSSDYTMQNQKLGWLCRLKFGALRPLPLMPTMLDVFENEEPDAVYGFVDELPVMIKHCGRTTGGADGKNQPVRLRLNYGMNGQTMTTIAPKFSALPDATYATSATYKVIADGVTVVNTTTITPTAAGGSVSVAINKLVKVLDIVLTVTGGGLVWSDWLANTNPMNAAKPSRRSAE